TGGDRHGRKHACDLGSVAAFHGGHNRPMAVRLLRRLPRNLVMPMLLGYLGSTLASWFLVWTPADGAAYYDAATRLTHGQPLYPSINPEAHEGFRYAPVVARAWLP